MRVVRLSGELGKKFGRVHRFDVKSPAEAVRALCANFPEFQKELMTSEKRNIGYKVFNGRHQSDEKELTDPAASEIRIVPAIMGANATTRIIIGSVLVAAGLVANATGVGAAASPYLIAAGTSLILGGVIELLSPVPKLKEPKERPENQPSYIFNGPVNTTAQGHPVPVGYGRLIVGGGIISAGISIDQIMAGYRRIKTEAVTTREFYIYSNNKRTLKVGQPALPENIYREELVSFEEDGYELLGEHYDSYVYKIYYYQITLELVPV